jgi:hypothetical protein
LHHQSHEGDLDASRHPQLQPQAEEGGGVPGAGTYARRRTHSAQYLAELHRDMERRQLVMEQIRQIEKARLERLQQAPKHRPNVMVLLLAQ